MTRSKTRFLYFIVFLRLSCPFLIFFQPTAAIIVNYLLDCWDGLIFNKLGYSLKTYRFIDQLLDFYWLTFILIYLISNRPEPTVFSPFLFFFLWRLAGVIIFFVGRKENHFIFFPNVAEHLFWVYIISKVFNLPELIQFPLWGIIILIFTIIKVFDEYLIHQKRFSLLNMITGKKILRWED